MIRMTNGTEYHSKLPDHILAVDPREPIKEGCAPWIGIHCRKP